jgi:hypothetical protein
VLATLALAKVSVAQQRCENGIIELPLIKTPARITLCHSVEQENPAVADQLKKILETLNSQQLRRLTRNVNSIGDHLETSRKAELLQSLLLKLLEMQTADNDATSQRLDTLNESIDDLRDKLLQARSSPSGTDETMKALAGSLGDAIAKLDLTRAEGLLDKIDAELKVMDKKLDTISEATQQTNEMLRKEQIAPAKIQVALASSDMSVLSLVRDANTPPTVIEEALRQPAEGRQETVAFRFFETSRHSAVAMTWLDWVLKSGLNPDMTVPNDYYESRGLLIEAMRAANVEAMKLLLQYGASPHPYEDLWLTAYSRTRFLFPLSFIADDARYSQSEKQQLAQAFVNAGLAIPDVPPVGGMGMTDEVYQVKQMREKLGQLAIPVATTPTLGQQAPNAICKKASKRTGTDWCSILATMPLLLQWNLDGGTQPLASIRLLYLLRIDGDTAYFLGRDSAYEDYVVVEVAKDGSTWNVLRFMEPEAGMGLCKKDGTSPQPDRCFRKVQLHHVANTDKMVLSYPGPSWKLVRDSSGR